MYLCHLFIFISTQKFNISFLFLLCFTFVAHSILWSSNFFFPYFDFWIHLVICILGFEKLWWFGWVDKMRNDICTNHFITIPKQLFHTFCQKKQLFHTLSLYIYSLFFFSLLVFYQKSGQEGWTRRRLSHKSQINCINIITN